MAKLCLPLGFVLAVMISADADNCLGGDCKAFGAWSMLQSKARKGATAKKHYAEDVRPHANSSLVAKAAVVEPLPEVPDEEADYYEPLPEEGMDHAMREQRHDGFDHVFATDASVQPPPPPTDCPNYNGVIGYRWSHNGIWAAAKEVGRCTTDNSCGAKCSAIPGCIAISINVYKSTCQIYTSLNQGKWAYTHNAYTKC